MLNTGKASTWVKAGLVSSHIFCRHVEVHPLLHLVLGCHFSNDSNSSSRESGLIAFLRIWKLLGAHDCCGILAVLVPAVLHRSQVCCRILRSLRLIQRNVRLAGSGLGEQLCPVGCRAACLE